MKKTAKITIVGSGALGGYYGAKMAYAGFNVHFLMRRDYEIVKRCGLRVKSCRGDFYLKEVKCYTDVNEIGISDVVFIGLKTTAKDNYESLIHPLTGPNTLILTAQNGLGNEEILASLFCVEQIAGGLAFICSNRTEAGVIEHLDYGHIHIGNYLRESDQRIRDFADIMIQSDIDCQVVENLALSRWKKLVWNVPFNGLSTWLDKTVDVIVRDQALQERCMRLMKEIQNIARAYQLEISDEFLDAMMTNTIKMAPYYTSMHLDRLQGRPMEIESIFGEPLRRAQARQVDTPELEMIYDGLIRIQNEL